MKTSPSRRALVLAVSVAMFAQALPRAAFADDPAPPAAATSSAKADAVASTPHAPSGFVVLAIGDSAAAAWPMAQKIYESSSLRPSGVDEDHARVLAGEAPDPAAKPDVKELAELRVAVHGEDAASKAVLASLAKSLNVRGIIIVEAGGGHSAVAHVFEAETGTFDAASYSPDEGPTFAWEGASISLGRAFGASPDQLRAPAAATSEVHAKALEEAHASRHFYSSPWFWGAIGAAALGAGAIFLATRDSGTEPIHLQMQVPK